MNAKPVVNLLRGWPNRALLPVAQIKRAAHAALSEPEVAFAGLEYGPDPGYEPCREAIASWLTDYHKPKENISASRLCITGGASQNLGCLLEVLTDPEYTRNIWIVAPAYFLAFKIFEDAGFGEKLRSVPEDQDGIDLDFLRREICKAEDKAEQAGNIKPRYKRPQQQRGKVYKHVIYCVPAFSNPSSRTMSLDRRRELVRLAREYDALIAPDDVYDFLQWPANTDASKEGHPGADPDTTAIAQLPRLVDVDRELDGGTERQGADGFGNACSNGTFSKIAGPGVRTGWVEGSEKFAYAVSQNGTTRSGGAPSQLTSTYVTQLLVTGELQRHIMTVLRPAYASRYRTMVRAIDEFLLPLGFAMPQPDRKVVGGYFVWLTLPEPLTAVELAERCQQDENIIIAPGGLFAVPGDTSITFEHSIRLCFAYEEESTFGHAVERIAHVAKQLFHRARTVSNDFVIVERSGGKDTPVSFNHFA